MVCKICNQVLFLESAAINTCELHLGFHNDLHLLWDHSHQLWAVRHSRVYLLTVCAWNCRDLATRETAMHKAGAMGEAVTQAMWVFFTVFLILLFIAAAAPALLRDYPTALTGAACTLLFFHAQLQVSAYVLSWISMLSTPLTPEPNRIPLVRSCIS